MSKRIWWCVQRAGVRIDASVLSLQIQLLIQMLAAAHPALVCHRHLPPPWLCLTRRWRRTTTQETHSASKRQPPPPQLQLSYGYRKQNVCWASNGLIGFANQATAKWRGKGAELVIIIATIIIPINDHDSWSNQCRRAVLLYYIVRRRRRPRRQ